MTYRITVHFIRVDPNQDNFIFFAHFLGDENTIQLNTCIYYYYIMSDKIRSRSEIEERLSSLTEGNKQIMSPIKGVKFDVAIAMLKWVLNGDN